MRLLQKHTAKFCVPLLFVWMTFCFTNIAHAQKGYTTISKNINPEAQSLYHDLSPQGDSLYLQSESIFYKVTFLNRLDRKIYTFNPPVLEGKISLHDIIVGDYTVLVYKKDRIIVFHISRLRKIEKPSEMIVSNDVFLSPDMSIVKTVITKVNMKERSTSKIIMNEIKMDEKFELSMEELKLAISDDNLKIGNPISLSKTRSYNLSSMDRKNMQSRVEYRRNKLRPNRKPYH